MKVGDLVRHRYLIEKYGFGVVIGGRGKYRMVHWPNLSGYVLIDGEIAQLSSRSLKVLNENR